MGLLSRITSSVAGVVDGAVLAAARGRFGSHVPRERADGRARVDRSRLLDEATAFYRQPAMLSGAQFFLPPPRATMRERRVRTLDDGEVVDISFESSYQTRWERMREDWRAHQGNRTGQVRMLRHATPQPALICLHGYTGGHYFIEERSFVARSLYRLGLDVALFTLPFHALRASRAGSPAWPSPNVARTNEGFGHAMHDLAAFIAWLRARGAPSVSACGMSLGANATALLATLEPLDFAGLMIPVASFGDLFWWHGEGRPERAEAEAEGITLDRMKAALEVVTPLARRPLLDGERVLVIDAEGDRITPREHATWLTDHFHARRLTCAGGHVLLGRQRPFRALVGRLRDLAILR